MLILAKTRGFDFFSKILVKKPPEVFGVFFRPSVDGDAGWLPNTEIGSRRKGTGAETCG